MSSRRLRLLMACNRALGGQVLDCVLQCNLNNGSQGGTGTNNDTSISSSVTSGEVDSHTDVTNDLTAKKIDLKDKCPRKIKRKLQKSSSGSPFNKKPKPKNDTSTKNDESRPEEANWIESPKELIFDRILGQGAFGKVLLCKHKKLNRFYAVKQMFTTEDEHTIRCEKEAMNIGLSCWNKFIMELRGQFVDYDKRACLVMDFMEGGDLLTDLEKQDGRFPEATARFYISELICGMEFLHLHGIVHRDSKFDNVLINREGHIKIADFGLSHYGTPFEEICDNEICGTDLYIAPEVRFLAPIPEVPWSRLRRRSVENEAVLGHMHWRANL
ncbi:protein kinase C-like 1B [Montipora capricornis]|uniref:protein kinase C-like 1B n=1 Tax=Montipora capricornis TaxID=246305 RepID=UPI0035F17F07